MDTHEVLSAVISDRAGVRKVVLGVGEADRVRVYPAVIRRTLLRVQSGGTVTIEHNHPDGSDVSDVDHETERAIREQFADIIRGRSLTLRFRVV